MTNLLSQTKKIVRQIRGLFPEALPVGMTEFNAFIDSIMSTYALPTQNRDSVAFSLSSMIMHLGPSAAYKSKMYFVIQLRAACAKQVAGAAFYEIKERQKAEEAAAREAAAKEAAANDQSG